MPVAIRETTVLPSDESHDVIQLYISDAPIDDESATFVLRILAKRRGLRMPTLAHLQRDVMATAQDALTPLLQKLAQELQEAGYGLQAPPRNPTR